MDELNYTAVVERLKREYNRDDEDVGLRDLLDVGKKSISLKDYNDEFQAVLEEIPEDKITEANKLKYYLAGLPQTLRSEVQYQVKDQKNATYEEVIGIARKFEYIQEREAELLKLEAETPPKRDKKMVVLKDPIEALTKRFDTLEINFGKGHFFSNDKNSGNRDRDTTSERHAYKAKDVQNKNCIYCDLPGHMKSDCQLLSQTKREGRISFNEKGHVVDRFNVPLPFGTGKGGMHGKLEEMEEQMAATQRARESAVPSAKSHVMRVERMPEIEARSYKMRMATPPPTIEEQEGAVACITSECTFIEQGDEITDEAILAWVLNKRQRDSDDEDHYDDVAVDRGKKKYKAGDDEEQQSATKIQPIKKGIFGNERWKPTQQVKFRTPDSEERERDSAGKFKKSVEGEGSGNSAPSEGIKKPARPTFDTKPNARRRRLQDVIVDDQMSDDEKINSLMRELFRTSFIDLLRVPNEARKTMLAILEKKMRDTKDSDEAKNYDVAVTMVSKSMENFDEHQLQEPVQVVYAAGLIEVEVKVNGNKALAIIDGGSEISTIRYDVLDDACQRIVDEKLTVHVKGFGGINSSCLGVLHEPDVNLDGTVVNAPNYVLKNMDMDVVLGRNWMRMARWQEKCMADGTVFFRITDPCSLKSAIHVERQRFHERDRFNPQYPRSFSALQDFHTSQ